MQFAVFGVGRQGAACIFDLLEVCGATAITAFDTAPNVRERLSEVLGGKMSRVDLHASSVAEAGHHDRIVELIRGCACVVGALPYALNPDLTKLCQRAGVPMCDLGGNPDVVARQQEMADDSILIMPDCGLAPGLNNLMTVYLRQKHGIESAKAYCGGIPAKRRPGNPLDYQLLFSPWGLISEYSGRCAVLRNGRVEYVEALTGLEALPGDREAMYTSNNSPLIFESLRELGLRDYEYKTVRWRGHVERVGVLKGLGFFCGNREMDQVLADAMSRAPWLQFDRRRDVDEVVLRVEGRASGGPPCSVGINVLGDARFSAMEKTTSWGITIPALWVAREAGRRKRALPRGCLTPERVVDAGWAMEELGRRTPMVREP